MFRTLAPQFDSVRARLAQLRRAFDARAHRERLLLIGAGLAATWLLANSLWLAPAFKDLSAAQTRRDAALSAVKQLNVEMQRQSADTRSTGQQLRDEVVQLRRRVGECDAALRAFGAPLVSAPEMVPMLARLLEKIGGMRLRSLQSLGRVEVGAAPGALAASAPAPTAAATATATAMKPASAAPGSNPTVALYRHGVELTIEGSYANVVAYLLAVEALPEHILWGGLQLKVGSFNLPLALSAGSATDSIARVRNGQIVAIGGLITQAQRDDRSGLPGLSGVPIFGALFRQKTGSLSKRELVILIKPSVIGDDGPWPDADAALSGSRR